MTSLNKCPLPWTQVFVDVNKSISPCCAPMELGNINDRSIAEIYNGPHFGLLRDDLNSGTSSLITSHCQNCYSWNKVKSSGKSFDELYPVGSDTELALFDLENSHPGFVENYRSAKAIFSGQSSGTTFLKPLRIEVQVGEHCDIDCIMCWQDHTKPRALRKKNLQEVYELLPYVLEITVTGGEPTIFPGFWELVDRFKGSCMPFARLQILTHGQHLADNLDKFDGITYLGFCVNVDGPNKNIYEHIRRGSSWEKLNENLSMVSQACSNNPGWGLNTTFLLMKSNIEMIEESISLANQYKANWSCGLIRGDYTPIERSNTFFAENIFRFGHLGFNKGKIITLLKDSLPAAGKNDLLTGANTATPSLKASIEEISTLHQIKISPSDERELQDLNSAADFSRHLQEIIAAQERIVIEDKEHPRSDAADKFLKMGEKNENVAAYARAIKFYKKADRIFQKEGRPSESIESKIRIGRCLSHKNPQQAALMLKDVLRQIEQSFGITHSKTATIRLELGKAQVKLNYYQQAESNLKEAYRTFSSLYGKQEHSSFIAVSAYELGKLYDHLNDPKALPLIRKSVRMFESLLGDGSNLTREAALRYHQLLVKVGEKTTAEKLFHKYSLRHFHQSRLESVFLKILYKTLPRVIRPNARALYNKVKHFS